MTTKSITSDQQTQFNRFVEDACRRGLKEIKPDRDSLQRLIAHGGEFQKYILDGVRRFSAKLPDYELARTILGKDFISPEEVAESRRGVVYTSSQLSWFGDNLPTREVLEWCRDNGYILVAGPPKALSLLEIRELNRDYFYSKESGWYAEVQQKFSRDDRVLGQWVMLRKGPVPNSTSRIWDEQQPLLSGLEIVPNAAEVIWGITTYKAVRNVYLLGGVYVRTSSLDAYGYRVRVGDFDADGLVVIYWDDGRRYGFIGLASARKTQ